MDNNTEKNQSVEFERRSTWEVLDVADAVPRVDSVRDLPSRIALVREAAVQATVVEQEDVTGLEQGRQARRVVAAAVRRRRKLGWPITRHEGREGSEHGDEAVRPVAVHGCAKAPGSEMTQPALISSLTACSAHSAPTMGRATPSIAECSSPNAVSAAAGRLTSPVCPSTHQGSGMS